MGPIVDSDFGDTVRSWLQCTGIATVLKLKDYVERIEDELRTIPNVAKLRRYGRADRADLDHSSLQTRFPILRGSHTSDAGASAAQHHPGFGRSADSRGDVRSRPMSAR